ncbi:MAG: MaoC family dehydratase N-terminal domain-containing protein [Dehalococcoidia bacterium]|nr:MaoC family dehydratase N-terminal domain-containing protein [Dehalococcoidia bacterium]
MPTPQVDFDRSLLGKPLPAGTFPVTAEGILAFCRAVGETNPLSTDEAYARRQGLPGLLAPPTYPNLFIRHLGRPEVVAVPLRQRLHAGQAVEPLRPIYAGDTLTATTRLKDVYTKTGRTGSMVFIVWETTFTNQRGEEVARVRESFMARL